MQLTDSFIPEIGGKQLVVHYLSTQLVRHGCKSAVLTNKIKRRHKYNFSYLVYVYPIKLKFLRILTNLFYIAYIGKFSKINIIHAHRTYPAGYCAVLIGRLFRIPTVITPHGDDILIVPKIKYGINLIKRLKGKSVYALKNASAIIALNEGMKNECIKLGVHSNKIHTIPIGINFDDLNNQHSLFQKTKSGKNLIVVGRHRPVKGYEVLLKAMEIVVKKDPDIKCKIVGKGTDKLLSLIRDLNLKDNIIIHGEIIKSIEKGMPVKLKTFYQNSDIYISSSLSESFSLTTLEAMAMGLPIISTDTVGIRGLIENNIDGLIVPVNNPVMMAKQILCLTSDYSLQKRLGEKARLKAKKVQYSWQDISLKHILLYKKLIVLNEIRTNYLFSKE